MTTAWLAVRPSEPIHHLDEVKVGLLMVKVLSSGFQVAVVSRPRTFEP